VQCIAEAPAVLVRRIMLGMWEKHVTAKGR
jgi:hypothetical protein